MASDIQRPASRPAPLVATCFLPGLLALGVAMVAGCASTGSAPRTGATPAAAEPAPRSEFDKSLDAWHGATVQELVRKLGKPDAINLRKDGLLDYQYSRSGRPGPDKRNTFSCTVRYGIEGGTQRVVEHAIVGC